MPSSFPDRARHCYRGYGICTFILGRMTVLYSLQMGSRRFATWATMPTNWLPGQSESREDLKLALELSQLGSSTVPVHIRDPLRLSQLLRSRPEYSFATTPGGDIIR